MAQNDGEVWVQSSGARQSVVTASAENAGVLTELSS